MNKPPLFVIRATPTGGDIEGSDKILWYGPTLASAQRALQRIKSKYGSHYREWHIAKIDNTASGQ